jgi:enoyl-CoA hydratase/carnithine racemase
MKGRRPAGSSSTSLTPERHSAEMWEQLPRAVEALDADPEVRVVLRGEARRGCADIPSSPTSAPRPATRRAAGVVSTAQRCWLEAPLARSTAPASAAACGALITTGASPPTTPSSGFPRRLGIGYEAAGVDALARAVGWSCALDLLLTARGIDAQEARRIGLVNEVRPAAELDDCVRERAGRIAENAPLTLRALKIAARELRKPEGLRDLGPVNAAYAACFASEDFKEGVAAFLQKRKPAFRGR